MVLTVGAAGAVLGCGGAGADDQARLTEALARVPIADAYDLRVALREPGGRRRIVKLVVDARTTPRPSGAWRATYEVDIAGRDPYVVESAARDDVVSVGVGRTATQPIPAEVGRRVTFASRLPRRVLDSPFVLAPYDRDTLNPTVWPRELSRVAGPDADTDRLEGEADAVALLQDLRSFVGSVTGGDPARRGRGPESAEMGVDIGPDGRVELLVARVRIAGGGRGSVQLRARPTGRDLTGVRATAGAPLRRLPGPMRGAVPPRVRGAFGVGAP
ncbi:hypothetical protein C7Y72_16370 [Paraconexibacter algicola]|uniref:Uncharacterized protein n=1 Tax=Paraconexibacter algicola TaxID=2133960 RepID=A0A2T4UFI2_9ACTN|nr:hypothetical protein C7Y72_16370 [Paraconexibacter algicola]